METSITELGTGIYVAEIEGVVTVNVGIVVGDDGACVIDTGTTQSEAEAISRTVARLTDKPLSYVINTHYHGDHSFGNWWLRPAIAVGHTRCRIRLLGASGESHRQAFARMMPQASEQISAVVVDPPAVTFEEEMSLHLGNVSLRLQYFGRAHTDNDIAITVEGTGHCFAGDMVEESGPPVAFESFPRDWGASMRSLLATDASAYIPGHGQAVDAAFVAAQADAFEDVDAACKEVQANSGAEANVPSLLKQDTHRVLDSQLQTTISRHFATA
jgi:glyoxylase-like metal-dependent hydrolase (beta-lactamase superfamily II)